ncbi:MAG: hypothetical protein QOH91_4269 [Mycobacterium sp.]|jgi:hypothetical protein|nr:hypothetical protein [Mycobacterium sp.]
MNDTTTAVGGGAQADTVDKIDRRWLISDFDPVSTRLIRSNRVQNADRVWRRDCPSWKDQDR